MMMKEEAFYVGRAVTSLQTMLRVLAMEDPTLPHLVPDGIYGPQTQKAVTAFQRRAGLPATGVTDLATWEAIRKAYEKALVEIAPAAPLDIGMHANQALLPGSDNLNVMLVQAMLHNLHLAYGNLSDCAMTGVCDEKTVAAIRCLQRVCGRPESGILDKGLWRLLAGLYTQAVGDGERKKVCPGAAKERAVSEK